MEEFIDRVAPTTNEPYQQIDAEHRYHGKFSEIAEAKMKPSAFGIFRRHLASALHDVCYMK